jgi:hypothetical protein
MKLDSYSIFSWKKYQIFIMTKYITNVFKCLQMTLKVFNCVQWRYPNNLWRWPLIDLKNKWKIRWETEINLPETNLRGIPKRMKHDCFVHREGTLVPDSITFKFPAMQNSTKDSSIEILRNMRSTASKNILIVGFIIFQLSSVKKCEVFIMIIFRIMSELFEENNLKKKKRKIKYYKTRKMSNDRSTSSQRKSIWRLQWRVSKKLMKRWRRSISSRKWLRTYQDERWKRKCSREKLTLKMNLIMQGRKI